MTRAEIISTVERRRCWTAEEKVSILDAAFRPGGSDAAAAERAAVFYTLIRTAKLNGPEPAARLREILAASPLTPSIVWTNCHPGLGQQGSARLSWRHEHRPSQDHPR